MTRDEHLAWCKERALEYVAAGELQNAMVSMLSDLKKHPELEDHPGGMLGVGLAMLPGSKLLRYPHEMRKWIEGFN
ncbi:MAG TPA: hypothetical protein VHA06_07045 [Candidatus Angelobacter sp.]|nr:hypothetical protein [Candidatus Angelobacter sp.]